MLPVGLQLYSVREDLEKDFEGTLKKVKAMGYEGVEFAGLYGHSAQEMKDAAQAAGQVLSMGPKRLVLTLAIRN